MFASITFQVPCFLFIILSLSISTFTHPTQARNNNTDCYCFPGEECWPTASQWDAFNRTVGGRLIATIPIASPCHENNPFAPYDKSACQAVRETWLLPQTHYESSSSIMAGFYANQSCDPFLPPSAHCITGTYVQYSVQAQSATDIQKTISFLSAHRIRLVVRNTGHDYLGKSTGAGAVAIWTHHLKEINFFDYQSPGYSGKAVKVGAGVQIFEANAAASEQNLVVVGGNCRTVGLAGGYTQGGGHGQLVSQFGLAADQVLEWEVISGTGQLITASPHNEYADLYWALSGGGGGTYGVVVSMVSKAYPELRTATANLSFTSLGAAQGDFDGVVDTFFSHSLGPLLEARGASVWFLTSASFTMAPTTIPGGSREQLQKILDPVLIALRKTNITYSYHIEEFPTFYSSFESMSPDVNVTEFNLGGRFIPQSILDSEPITLTDKFRVITGYGATVSGISVNASRPSHHDPKNSVNPAWRTAAISLVVGTPFSSTNHSLNIVNQQLITDTLIPELVDLVPGSGAYLNEGDAHQPEWQTTFYGRNYNQLLKVKKRYDPLDIFYALTGVGSEAWAESIDGRLCRIQV
ncbi:FAD/FMN-containing dehydrogenase [Aspergillus steynii IBT 23096]|uniref:FAD/FMN-containing dehydrogenase n=1 Tax=Aspergillus steynii IBT 23096 TaxID=1392250 RepID=A0A2I2GD89_9EURO|nr:FAD/FMN-containing dehydrogenase [Aspergillus steynii IBT 23096]PLB50868.1 FAD/FMN-containing dehydrogenase [Aspergillus steynii IBT 23096]